LHFPEEESDWLFEETHVLTLYVFMFVARVDVVEPGPAKHAEDEEEVGEGDGYVGSGGVELAVGVPAYLQQLGILGGRLVVGHLLDECLVSRWDFAEAHVAHVDFTIQ